MEEFTCLQHCRSLRAIRHRAHGNVRTDQHWSATGPQTRTAHFDTSRRLTAVSGGAAADTNPAEMP